MFAARIGSVLGLALVGCTCENETRLPAAAAPVVSVVPVGPSSGDPPAVEGSLGISLTSHGSEVLASWVEPAADGAHRIRFATFDAARMRWGEASTVAEGADVLASSVELPTAVRSGGGAVWLTFLRSGSADEASSIHLATSDDGVRWQARGPIHDDATDTEHGHVSLLVEGDRARAVWLDGRAWIASGPMAIRTALLGADGARTDETVLDDRVCDCCQTGAALASDGPIVVYRDRDEAERRDVAAVRRTDTGWSEPIDVASDGWTIRGCPVNGPQVAAHGGHVVTGWYSEGSGAPRVRVAFSRDAGAHFESPIEIDGARPLGRVDVEWMDDGTALVSWLGRGDDENGAVLVRRVSADRRVSEPLEIARVAGATAFGAPRVARLGADLMVAWSDPGPPRRVRASVLRAGELPALADEPLAAIAPPAGAPLGTVSPDVTLPALSGEPRSIRSFRGRPLVLSFFATWCIPCREEIPVLAALAARHGDGVAVVGVSLDETAPESVARFARERGVTYPVLLDPAGAHLGGTLGVPPIPATFVLDGDGRIVLSHRGGGATLEGALGDALEGLIAGEAHAHEHAH